MSDEPSHAEPRLMDRVRAELSVRRYSPRTAEAYEGWIRRYILFHGTRHPRELGSEEVRGFLEHLASARGVSASTHGQALAALVFLYVRVLGVPVAGLDNIVRPRRSERIPIVLTRDEVDAVLRELTGVYRLMASLLYGAGLRLLECVTLRAKDVDLVRREITIREGKGRKDRRTVLPDSLASALCDQLSHAHRIFEKGVGGERVWVAIPSALSTKYPNAGREWPWQWLFAERQLHLPSDDNYIAPSLEA